MDDFDDRGPNFTRIEFTIMQAVWGGNKTSREIYDALPDAYRNRMAFSTVSTYIHRMVYKNYLLKIPTSTREYHFIPSISKQEAKEHRLAELEAEFGLAGLEGAARRLAGKLPLPKRKMLERFLDDSAKGGQ